MDLSAVRERIHTAVETSDITGAVWAVADEQTETIESVGLPVDAIVRIASLTKPLIGCVATSLFSEGRLSPDDSIDPWLPELADRRVLRSLDAELDDTEPADRHLTVRDLLLMGGGGGWTGTATGAEPIYRAIEAAGAGPGVFPPNMTGDAWAQAVGQLPMIHQPGAGWSYDSSFTALGIVLERATGTDLGSLVAEHVTDPAGMTDTGYTIAEAHVARLPALIGLTGDKIAETSPAANPDATNTPTLRSGATGLYSTMADLVAFSRALHQGRIGSPELNQDERLPGQIEMSATFLEPGRGWGWGMGVDLKPRLGTRRPGRYGWEGGSGTALAIDPHTGTCAIYLSQSDYFVPGTRETIEAFLRLTSTPER